jgi:two-component system OmpR family sensor kinase
MPEARRLETKEGNSQRGTAKNTSELVFLKDGQPVTGIGLNGSQAEAPFWLRPFFSLRAQLLVVYTVLLILILLTLAWLVYAQSTRPYVLITALVLIAIGGLLTVICTTVLLRPLARVIDVAQALASGDLQQRQRLILHLPPQDDIDRLAGSLDEMARKLEAVGDVQRASELRFKRFFSDASHQLRTPLTSIRGFTEILMRGAIDDQETRQRVLQRMKGETERMTLLINNLLTLARLDDNHPLKMSYVDLLEVVLEIIEQSRGRASENCQIVLDLHVEKRLGLQADRERIKQLLFIVLDNALKYGCPPTQGVITLRLSREQDQAVISVIDNGPGIDSNDLEHIFDSFFRGRGRGTASGVGLGLTIASTIARLHGGTITATSRPGRTEFMLRLPSLL